MNYSGVVTAGGTCEIVCGLCGDKYIASSGQDEAIAWAAHHGLECPKNEDLKGVVEKLDVKFESFSIGGAVEPPPPTPPINLKNVKITHVSIDATPGDAGPFRLVRKEEER